MKKLSIMLAALLVAMTGCQKEPVGTQENQGNDADAKHYVAVNISLPFDAGTKAEEKFDHGTTNEYKVKSITLVFFDTEGNYIAHQDVTPNPWSDENTDGEEITVSKSTGAVEVKHSNIAQVLVILNNKVDLNDSFDFHAKNTEPVTAISTIIGDSSDEFMMTNAPSYNNDGTFSYLVAITPTTDKNYAENNPVSVKVERVTSKVTLEEAESIEVKNGAYSTSTNPATFDCLAWNLDITNKYYYPVRLCQEYEDANSDWWKTGTEFINPGINTTKRVYFAVDSNYDNASPTDEFNEINAVDGNMSTPQYCLENTFNTKCMKQLQSTRVVLKAEYVPGVIKTGTDETWPSEDKTWYKVNNNAYTPAALQDLLNVDPATLSFTNGECNAYESEYGLIYKYTKAICYYPIIIRHFDLQEMGYADTFTESDFLKQFGGTPGGYTPQDLGRYGVVRNNWYNLTINSVSQPGEPEIPAPGEGDDDEIKRYLSCTIDILAWRLRDQGVDL